MTEQEDKSAGYNNLNSAQVSTKAYREMTMLEEIDSEIRQTVYRLKTLQEKKDMLLDNPSLEDTIKKFNRY